MKTKLIYLDDSYQKEMDAEIIDVQEEADGKWRLVLNQTVFYPMGGGQPTDQGTLTSPDWSGEVYQVMMKDAEIWHYVNASVAPMIGKIVHGAINWERRYKNMRVHSGGHIIDFAMYLLGYSPKTLSPIKADHGKKPFIIYKGTIVEDIKQKLEDKANELVENNLKFSWDFQPLESLQKEAIYLQPNLPTNKPLRTFRLEGVGAVADGGTQLKTTGEAGKIILADIAKESGNTIVKYSIKI